MQDNDEKNEIEKSEPEKCLNLKELSQRLQDEKSFIIKKQNIDILDGLEDTRHLTVEQVCDGWEVVIKNLNDVMIEGEGSHLFSHFESANVITFINCNNVTISGLKLGHKVEMSECCGSVIEVKESANFRMIDVELYGCGAYGIYATDSSICLEKMNIHHCKYGAINAKNTEVEIKDSIIHDCTSDVENLIDVENYLKIENLEICGNKSALALIKGNPENTELKSVYIHDNKYRKNYYWGVGETEIQMKNNELLGWN
jgi:hypothetical protein